MELTFFYISVFIFGLLFGSFSSVLIGRWKNKENGILMGRSACPHCKNTL
jgi:bacterial peptidase A24 N-terminal domain